MTYNCVKCLQRQVRLTLAGHRVNGYTVGTVIDGQCDRCTHTEESEPCETCETCEGTGIVTIENEIRVDDHTKWMRQFTEWLRVECPDCDGRG